MNDNAVFCILRPRDQWAKYWKIVRRNKLLRKNLPGCYDVVIFIEKNIPSILKKIICAGLQDVKFVKIDDSESLLMANKYDNMSFDTSSSIGYRMMCYFRSIEVWVYLSNYKYMIQMDDDGWLESKIQYNIFNFVKNNNISFGYVDDTGESHTLTINTLSKFTEDFVKSNNINKSINEIDIYLNNMPVNHFFIIKSSFINRDDVQSYLKSIVLSEGIWKYRWGDSPILYMCTQLFMNESNYHKFNDFDYTHGNHCWSNYEKKNILPPNRFLPHSYSSLSPTEFIYWIFYAIWLQLLQIANE
jgi:hypothetical protein